MLERKIRGLVEDIEEVSESCQVFSSRLSECDIVPLRASDSRVWDGLREAISQFPSVD